MADIIQFKRGLSTAWTSINPVLADTEIGVETDTGKEKQGDAITPWNNLPYKNAGILISAKTYADDQDVINLQASKDYADGLNDPTVDHEYLTIPAMLSLQNEQLEDDLIKVEDAGADSRITGKAYYFYNGTIAGTIDDYHLLSNSEVATLTGQAVIDALGYTPANETEAVKSIAVNGTTYNRDVNGLVDLGTISGGGGASLLSKSFTYTSGAQTFTADFDIVQVGNILVGGTPLQKTQYTVSGAVVTITDPLTSGAVIELNYWKANAVNAVSYTKAESDVHINSVSNPHSVTKSQVGLSNVDNTSDAAKPISTAQQTALNTKQNTLTNPITGTGTVNKISKFTSAGEIGDSVITELANGNLGINKTNPNNILDIVPGASFTGETLRVNGGVGQSGDLFSIYSKTGSRILGIDNNVNVNFGTGVYFNNSGFFANLITARSSGSQLRLIGRSNPNSALPSVNISADSGLNDADIAVQLGASDGGKMVIQKIGNVGISTGSPSEKLDVIGNIKLSGIHILGQYTTATRPAYVKGSQFFDTTINKMVIGGATAWEEVTSS